MPPSLLFMVDLTADQTNNITELFSENVNQIIHCQNTLQTALPIDHRQTPNPFIPHSFQGLANWLIFINRKQLIAHYVANGDRVKSNIICKNLKRASTYKPSQEEIDRAVNVILTAELLENQSMSDLSMGAALDELYGLGYDHRQRLEALYRKIKPADVVRVGRKYLAGDYVVTVTTRMPENLKTKTKQE